VDEEVVGADSIRAVAVDKAPAADKAPVVVWVAAVWVAAAVAVGKARVVAAPVVVWVAAVVEVDKARVVVAPVVVWVAAVVEVATTVRAETMDPAAAVAETIDPVAVVLVVVGPVAVGPVVVGPVVVVGVAQVPSLPRHGHGQPRTSTPLASTKLSPGNSKSTVFWNSSTRASRPTSTVKKSNSCPP
jgi:hypothetical protein